MHFAEELTGRYRENRPSYPAIAISDVSHISCVGNDFGSDSIFSRYLEGVGKNGGKINGLADVEIRVPHFGYADRVQEIHIKVIHILILLIEKEMVKTV